jgi:hypothetical protein
VRLSRSIQRVPEKIDHRIASLIEEIGVSEEPLYIDVTPEPYAEVKECFSAVNRKVGKDGGSRQLGWQIWQIPDIMIEAEFHAVWKSPKGKLVDITPKSKPINRILFVPDCNSKYDGSQRNNIRLNLSGNRLVDDFIRTSDAIHRLMNKGQRAYMREIDLSDDEALTYQSLLDIKKMILQMAVAGKSINALCICGSGKKYRFCHALILSGLLEKIYVT